MIMPDSIWNRTATRVAAVVVALGLCLGVAAVGGAQEPPDAGHTFRDCGTCPEMVVLPKGSFQMGSSVPGEGPVHSVRIGYALAVGKYEVTFEEWDACVAAGGCGGYRPDDRWGRGTRPVISVSWEDARLYTRWLSRRTGQRYRLLSEAEWEYAARAGTTTTRYWGDDESEQCGYANGYDDDASCKDGYEYTAPVGVYAPNAWDIYDMLGNVQEWVEDCWHQNYAGAPSDGRFWPGGDCSMRVMRGASWYDEPMYLTSASRQNGFAGRRVPETGFRVARTFN